MPNVLVTGGAGFIGSHLTEALVAQGHAVCVLDDLSTGKLANLAGVHDRVEFIHGSITDPEALRQAAAGAEYVFHQAALASVRESILDPVRTNKVNVEGTLNILNAAREAGARRVVVASSSAVYGDQDAPLKHEDLPARPISPYGVSKLAAEQYALAFYRSYGLETVALRYFNVYGPRQAADSPYAAVIPKFVDAILAGRRPVIYGDGTQRRDFIYVGDVVAANLAAMQAEGAAGQVLNVATGRSVSLNELIGQLREVIGWDISPEYAAAVPGDIHESTADVARAAQGMAFGARTPLGEGLKAVIARKIGGPA